MSNTSSELVDWNKLGEQEARPVSLVQQAHTGDCGSRVKLELVVLEFFCERLEL